MKRLLKVLLMLVVLLAVVYVSSPWWIPSILARQLPADWQLETLKISWPGFKGVNVQHLKAIGELPGMDVVVEAENSRLSYQGLATQVDLVVLNFFLSSEKDQPAQNMSIDDLSLPMFHLSADLPTLAVKQAQLALHLASDGPGNTAGQPIVLNMQGINLSPADTGRFHLETTASIAGMDNVRGHINVEAHPDTLRAQVRFPADRQTPSWLNLEFFQEGQAGQSELTFQFDSSRHNWLNELLSKSTAGRLTQVGGKLNARALFRSDQISGDRKNFLNSMVLDSDRLEVTIDGNETIADFQLDVTRDQQSVNIVIADNAGTGAAYISLQDRNGYILKTMEAAVPELTRSKPADPDGATVTLISEGVLSLTLPPGTNESPSLEFTGGLSMKYLNLAAHIELRANDVNLALADTNQIGNTELTGDIEFLWFEELPFSYTSESLSIAANSLSSVTKGKLDWKHGNIRFEPSDVSTTHLVGLKAKTRTGDLSDPGWIELTADDLNVHKAKLGFELLGVAPNTNTSFVFDGPVTASMPTITLFSPADTAPTVVSATELNMTGKLVSDKGMLASSGDGYMNEAKIMPMDVSATQLELDWADLDLSELTGALGAKTRNLKVKIEEDIWTGFDLNAKLKLERDDVIEGDGDLAFGGGTAIPFRFSGSTVTGWWDIDLPKQLLPVTDMRSILRSAHKEIPAELNLSAGTIEIAGQIQIHDEISAKLDLSGTEIAADLAETDAQQTSFSLAAGYGQDVYASGPIAIKKLGLAGGIDITDINTGLNLQNSNTIGLSELSAILFDGRLDIQQFNYSDGGIEDTAIHLTHINLQKLLAFLDVDGLQGEGFLDFSLPAGSKGAAIHIVDGTFSSTEPGRLSYSKGDMASTNIGLQALDNFHYDNLSGKIAYDSSGPYQITVHLEGSNPDLYDGYPLVFNLTINGSLPELFEAMFLTGSFEDSVLKQINMKESQ